jgi:predicted DNA repair protein MutK
MSGLLALLDDVAAIAKVAAASVDDIGAAALKAGSKTAGVVIDDAAVTPKYVQGFDQQIGVVDACGFADGGLCTLAGLALADPRRVLPVL